MRDLLVRRHYRGVAAALSGISAVVLSHTATPSNVLLIANAGGSMVTGVPASIMR